MKRETWGSKIGFVFAVAGSAVGLANIWRFPYVVGQNGGGAFLLIYLLFLFLIGFPVLVSEILIGRTAQTSPSGAFGALGPKKGGAWGGKLTILTGFLVSAFYSAVAGWILGYLVEAALGNINSFATVAEAEGRFGALLADPLWGVGFHTLFLLICGGILYFGVREGIERATSFMMPLLLVMLLFLTITGLKLPHSERALAFLFTPDWNALTPTALITALGQAFFTLSLGQGTMVTYGSYLKKRENIVKTVFPVVLMDLAVSLMAAIAVFTIVFAVEGRPDSGPGLLFETLPWVFSRLPGGYLMALIFFLLVTIAAVTSEISAMQPAIAYLQDEWKCKRSSAVLLCTLGAFLLGIPCALSFSLLAGVRLFDLNILELMEFACSSFLIPIGGLLAVLLVGWCWGIPKALAELRKGAEASFDNLPWLQRYFAFTIRYLAPILILIVFLNSL